MIRWAIWNGARTADRNQARVYVQKLRGRDRPEDHATVNPVSLDTLYGLDDKDHCMAIGIMDRPNETLANESFDRFLGYIRKPRVRYVLEQHYRFERTLVDIGRDLGVSRERVRQLLVQGQEVIRQKLDMEGREK
jgi:DNA-directed RNA polymerase sigma subunit (sigma70/sigma32)